MRDKPDRHRSESRRAAIVGILALAVLLVGAVPDSGSAGPTSAGVELDPLIQALIDSVDTSRMMNHIQILQDFFTRHTWSDSTQVDIGIGAARKWIIAELESLSVASGGDLTPSYFDYDHLFRWSRNVMAVLPGTMPASEDRIFLLGGHFDSRTGLLADAESFAPGANDNASGTAAVMEIARLMAPYTWETTTEFHLFSGEEQGLLGAKHYAEWADTNGLNIEGALILDMISGVENPEMERDSVHVRFYADTLALSQNMERYLKRIGEAYVPEAVGLIKTKPDRPSRGSDHLAFSDRGFTAMRFVELMENSTRQHGINDLIDYVHSGYLTQNTKLALAAFASLALAPTTPTGLTAEVTAEGHLYLSWPTVNPEPDLAGYLVAYRGTDPPGALIDDSTESAHTYTMVPVGMVNEHYLVGPAPGDSVWVGLCAVDSAGHESLVSEELPLVMPTPTDVASFDGLPRIIGMGAPFPNPAIGDAQLELSIGMGSARGELALYDVRGRRVRTLWQGDLSEGRHLFSWDLKDEGGRRVPTGIYLCRFEADSVRMTRKLVVTP